MKDKDFPFEKLRRCPFCGNDNISVDKGDAIVYCDCCDACKTISPDFTDEEIIKDWNTRTDQKEEGVKRKIDLRLCLMNIRRTQTKAWNKRTSNRWLVQEIVGCGNGTAYKVCDEINIDPDKYEINWSEEGE